jgi:membrane fusion protein (multidrug efflux system)
MQQPSVSNTERRQTIYADQEGTHTHLAHDAGNTTIAGDAKSLFTRKRMLIAAITLIVVIAAGWLIRGSVLYERTDEAQMDGRIMPLSARINGQIEQVNVVDGQLVHAGDVLAVIDQREYSIAVIEALASLAYVQNTAATLHFNAALTITSAYGGLNAAQASVKNASIEVEAAKHKLRADEAVLKQTQVDGYAAEAVVAADQQVLLQAQNKLIEAITNQRTAQTAPQQVSLAKAEAQAGDSQVLQRKGQLDQAQLNLSYTIIRSPVTGIVGRTRLAVGQSVIVGQHLIDIVSLNDVWITANFKESQLARLRPGQPVQIKIDAYGRTWKGHVTNLGGSAGSVFSVLQPKISTGNRVKTAQRVPIRIDFDRPEGHDFNAEGMLKPGLSAESDVQVRWLPRVRAPNRLPAGRGPIPAPTAL